MPTFGKRSKQKLELADPRWKPICWAVIPHFDLTVIHSFRDKELQNELFATGASKSQWPYSKHNINAAGRHEPGSIAIDVAPWNSGIDWKNTHAFAALAGMLIQAGAERGVEIGWGGDWDRDDVIMTDQTFQDLGHFWIVGSMTPVGDVS